MGDGGLGVGPHPPPPNPQSPIPNPQSPFYKLKNIFIFFKYVILLKLIIYLKNIQKAKKYINAGKIK